MKILGSFLLLVPAVAFSQMPVTPGIGAAGQAAQAFQAVQAQTMMMTSQSQVQATIMSQAAMMNSVTARGIFMAQAAGLQARAASQSMMAMQSANQSMISASIRTAMQQQMMAQSAILRMRTLGIENQSAMVHAVQLASLDMGASQRRNAMLHTVAAQQSAGKQSVAPVQQVTPDALPVEAPPMMIRPTFGMSMGVEKPKFSVPGGKVTAGTKVKIKSDTHYATLYYTTNGWTPTTQSAKYTGPITINGTTHLQVMAMGPNYQRSPVERVDYEVPEVAAGATESAVSVPSDGTLRAGTPVRVVFGGKEFSSETASVGDEITLLLDEDIRQGDKVLAAKGSPVTAALTIADAGHGSAPGDLVFEVHSVEVAGKRVPLFGGETLEGVKGGKDAVISPGMTAMAFVSADTAVK